MVQVEEILASTQVGKKWNAEDYLCYRERESIDLFNERILDKVETYTFDQEIPRIGKLRLEDLYTNKNILVPEKLALEELEIRHKKTGDFICFKHGKKKLKKFFTDEKWSNFRKQRSFVVAKGNEIYWLEGL